MIMMHALASNLGMTLNLPVSPFADRLAGACIAQTDQQVLEVIKEPGFSQWVVYLLVFMLVADKFKNWFVPAKREVSGELVTSPKEQPATKTEVASLREDLDSFIEQNRAEHQNAITEGQRRVVNLSEVMDRETSELESAIGGLRDSLGTRMDAAFAALHLKMDPLIKASAAAAALIDQIDKRLSRLEEQHTHEVTRLHARIDDAIRTSLTAKPAK